MPRTGNHEAERHAERTPRFGALDPQDDDRDRHDDEREQRADAGHLAEDLNRDEAGHDGHDDAGDHRGDVGRAEPGVHLADAGGQQLVAAHREEDARLAHEHDEQHAGDAGDGAGRHQAGGPVLVDDAQRVADRRIQELDVVLVLDHRQDAAQDGRDRQVQHGADDQGSDDADRQVPARVLGLLGRRRDGVEADIGEEDDRGPRRDARESIRHERMPVLRLDVGGAHDR